jgi:hypothetical protein
MIALTIVTLICNDLYAFAMDLLQICMDLLWSCMDLLSFVSYNVNVSCVISLSNCTVLQFRCLDACVVFL